VAGLSEPDNVLYGTITLDGQLITAARTDIVVEARRTADGPAVAAYRIGDDRRLAGFYRLNLKLETAAPLADPLASLDGDRLFVVARNDTDLLIQKTIEIGPRGLLTRLDLDAAQTSPDQDGNGLADAWELLYFGRTGNDPQADPDQDGHSNLEEFQAGTTPRDAGSVCRLEVDPLSAPPKVAFLARRAEGAGYDAHIRYFTLETSPGPAGGWKGVTGFTGIAGDGRVVVHPIPVGTSPAFYRLRVWLQAR